MFLPRETPLTNDDQPTEMMNNPLSRVIKSYGILFILCIAAHGLFVFSQGFYWDDWSQLFLHLKFGDSMFWDYFSGDRPTSAWTGILLFPILGESPVKWHLFILFLQFSASVLFYQILSQFFSTDSIIPLTASALFCVCPVFSQQYISIAYSQHFLDLNFFLLSVLFIIQALRSSRKIYSFGFFFASLIFTLIHLSITEYFSVLELIKVPLILSFFFSKQYFKPNRKMVIFSLALVLLSFTGYVWFRLNFERFFPITEADRPELLYILQSHFFEGVKLFIHNASVDLLYIFTNFIGKLFTFDLLNVLSTSSLVIAFSSLITSLFYFFSAKNILRNDIHMIVEQHNWLFGLFFAILWIIFAIIPFWVIGDNVLETTDPPHADRCFLAASPGICLLFALLFKLLCDNRKKYFAVTAILIFLFTRLTLNENNNARLNTIQQNNFYWQLATRIPGIKDGTVLTSDNVIFPSQGNFSTASAVNILYPNPIQPDGQVPVWITSYENRSYEQHGGYNTKKRVFYINGSSADTIYLDQDNKFANCVWFFSPEDVDNPHVTDIQRSWIKHSNVSNIDITAEIIPNRIIFGEPPENWCIAYQNAALLRQQGKWKDLAIAAKDILHQGYTPSDSKSNSPFEWWPFIEGLIRSGDNKTANELIEQSIQTDPAYKDFFTGRVNSLK